MAALCVCAGVALLAAACQAADSGGGDSKFGGGSSSLTLEVIKECGYIAETHRVQTRHGYVSTVFHLKKNSGRPGRPIVMQHGFISSSDTWFQLGKDSLPCLLTSDGYDVWVTNARGNHYSKQHASLSIESYEYWDFSFHEIAIHDVTATIDYICSFTKKDRVSYVGHSMGGAINFALLSTAREYNSIIDVSVTLAPACFLNHTTNIPVKGMAYMLPYLQSSMTLMTWGELLAIPNFMKSAPANSTDVLEIVNALGYVLNMERMHKRSTYIVDSTSIKTAEHLAQAMREGTFAWYDYGEDNYNIYGQGKPPDYEIGKITTRQFIMYSDGDDLVTEPDVLRLCAAVTSAEHQCYKVPQSGFEHSDFLTSRKAKELVYSVVRRELGGGAPASRPAGGRKAARRRPANRAGRGGRRRGRREASRGGAAARGADVSG